MNRSTGWAAAAVLGLLACCPAALQAARVGVEIGSGIRVPFSDSFKRDFGLPVPLDLTLTLPTATGDRSFLELSWVQVSGLEYEADATFNRPGTRIRLLPLCLGIRYLTPPSRPGGGPELGLTMGLEALFARWQDPTRGSANDWKPGVFFESHPGFRLSRNIGGWLRGRLTIIPSLDFATTSREYNFSGVTVQAGLAFGGGGGS